MFSSCENNTNSNDDSNNQTSTGNPDSSGNSGSNSNSGSGNNSSDNENPSPTLSDNVGENPIKETITLIDDKWREYYLKLNPDGTALYIDDDDETKKELNYTYNADKEEIQMQVKKTFFYGFFESEGLMTYNEIISQIDKEYTVENTRKMLKNLYEDDYEEEYESQYPGCNSYEDFEKAILKDEGFGSLDDYLKYWKQLEKAEYKAEFAPLPTYSYKIDDYGEMTLTEKFTGVKNMIFSNLYYHDASSETHVRIYNSTAIFEDHDNDEYFYGTLDTDNKTIAFRPEKGGEQVTAKYTEDISEGTVTLTFNGKDYLCKFEGVNFHEK